jgi:hypothetical protein
MAGFTGYNDLISEMNAGKRFTSLFSKTTGTVVIGAWGHLWPVNTNPGALYTGTALQFARTTETTAGSMYHGGNKTADTKHLISASIHFQAANGFVMMLVDQVGYYPITPGAVVGAGNQQTFDYVNTLPDRYISAGDPGLQVSLVTAGAAEGTACNLTELTYMNQDGTDDKTMPYTMLITPSLVLPATTVYARVATAGAGVGTASPCGPFIPLAVGDTGVRKLKTCTFSVAKNLMAFVLVKPLATIPVPALSGAVAERDFVSQLACLERIYDGACLTWIIYPVATATSPIIGNLEVAWG